MSFLSNFLEAQALSARYHRELTVLIDKHPPAVTQGKTECCRSGVCCWKRPGQLSPEDVSRVAAFLGISEQELFQKFLVVDGIEGTILLLPARRHQVASAQTGRMLDWRETYSLESPCVFLAADNACSIHEVKPQACKNYKCWEHGIMEPVAGPDEFPRAKLLELGWDDSLDTPWDDILEALGD